MKIITIDVGDTVICDFCNEDYTKSHKCGGLLFCSYAICPDCSKSVNQYEKRSFIKATCPDYMPFSDWVRNVLRANH